LKYLSEIKRKSPEVKEGILDCNAFKKEYTDKVKEYNQKIKEYCKTLKDEMNMLKYKKDYINTRTALIKTFKSQIKQDSIYNVALQKVNKWKLERWLCGRTVYFPHSYRYMRTFRL
jgi:hypothetical protein